MERKTRQELLDHYAGQRISRFIQVDGFPNMRGDAFLRADEDGDAVGCQMTEELMSGEPAARLLIQEDADVEDVRRLLVKFLEGVDHWFEFLADVRAEELFARADIHPTPIKPSPPDSNAF